MTTTSTHRHDSTPCASTTPTLDGAADHARRRRAPRAPVRPAVADERALPLLLPHRASRPRAALLRLADVDHGRRDALVALDGDEIVAVARYDGRIGSRPGRDRRHGRGRLAAPGRRQAPGRSGSAALAVEQGYDTFVATMLPDNRAALGLVRKLVPDATVRLAGGEYEADDAARRARAEAPRSRRRAVSATCRCATDGR